MFKVFYKQCGEYTVYSIRDIGESVIPDFRKSVRPDFLIYINGYWEWVSSAFCTPVEEV